MLLVTVHYQLTALPEIYGGKQQNQFRQHQEDDNRAGLHIGFKKEVLYLLKG
jgi:hypothetical protein